MVYYFRICIVACAMALLGCSQQETYCFYGYNIIETTASPATLQNVIYMAHDKMARSTTRPSEQYLTFTTHATAWPKGKEGEPFVATRVRTELCRKDGLSYVIDEIRIADRPKALIILTTSGAKNDQDQFDLVNALSKAFVRFNVRYVKP